MAGPCARATVGDAAEARPDEVKTVAQTRAYALNVFRTAEMATGIAQKSAQSVQLRRQGSADTSRQILR